MSNELSTVTVQRALATPLEFSPEQRQMIRDTYANGASDAEFAVLMEVARVRRLNPLLRQVHFVKRYDGVKKRDVWSVQVSIDGMRAIAERTGLYAGQDEPEFIEDANGHPTVCKVRVWRKDWPRPVVGVAYFKEYVQTTRDGAPTRFWSQMEHTMISKCAEAVGLRKAFPEDMAGLYAPEEMGQADNDRPAIIAESEDLSRPFRAPMDPARLAPATTDDPRPTPAPEPPALPAAVVIAPAEPPLDPARWEARWTKMGTRMASDAAQVAGLTGPSAPAIRAAYCHALAARVPAVNDLDAFVRWLDAIPEAIHATPAFSAIPEAIAARRAALLTGAAP